MGVDGLVRLTVDGICAGLNFDEHDRLIIQSNDIDLPMSRAVLTSNDAVPEILQVARRCAFSSVAEQEMQESVHE